MIETRALYNSGFLAATFLAQVCTMSAVSDDGIDGDGGDCCLSPSSIETLTLALSFGAFMPWLASHLGWFVAILPLQAEVVRWFFRCRRQSVGELASEP